MGPSIGFLRPVSYQQLVEHFGVPLVVPDPEAADGRIQVLWRIAWTDGSANEIYDYKVGPHWLGPFEGTHFTKLTEWDVSGGEPGYRHLIKLFGVEPDVAEKVANPTRERRRPNLGTEVVSAFVPGVEIPKLASRKANPEMLKQRLLR